MTFVTQHLINYGVLFQVRFCCCSSPFYLSAEAQGYWYTFVSLAALAVFADMGFSAILMLFSSHEFAHLRFAANYTLVGDEQYVKRLATLWRFSLKWAGIMACVVFPIVLAVGFVLLSGKEVAVDWGGAWVIYGVASMSGLRQQYGAIVCRRLR